MNEEEFVQQAQQDEPVAAFLAEVADEVRGGQAPTRFGVSLPDPMQLAVAYAVWSLLKLGIATLRAYVGLELAQRTGVTVEFLISKGYPREVAETTVKTVQENLLKQSDDSPILQALLKLVPGSAPKPTGDDKAPPEGKQIAAPEKDKT